MAISSCHGRHDAAFVVVAIDTALAAVPVRGERYPEHLQRMVGR